MQAMRRFAGDQVSNLLGRLAFEVHHAARSRNPGNVHDLRVSMRRFNAALDIFGELLPRKETKKIRRRLDRLMKAAAAIRDRDIAMALVDTVGVGPDAELPRRLAAERKGASQELAALLRNLEKKNFSAVWRSALELTGR